MSELTLTKTLKKYTKDEVEEILMRAISDLNNMQVIKDTGIKIKVEHYSVIHTVINNSATYLRTFDTKEKADEYCTKLNVAWEGLTGGKK